MKLFCPHLAGRLRVAEHDALGDCAGPLSLLPCLAFKRLPHLMPTLPNFRA